MGITEKMEHEMSLWATELDAPNKIFEFLNKRENLCTSGFLLRRQLQIKFPELINKAAKQSGVEDCAGYTEETLSEIIRIHPASMAFSVYSGIPEEHDYITGIKGSFQKTLATLKKVKAAGMMVSIKTPVMAPTLNGFPVVQALCKELDVRHEVSYFICPTNHGDISPIKLRLGNVEKYKQVMKLKQREKESDEFRPRDVHGAICGAGQLTLSVNPYGEVFPCNGFNYRLGNIKETSIEEIWNGEALRRLYELRFEQLGDSCLNCRYRDDCLYCVGSSLSENGNIFSPVKESCKIAQAAYELRMEQ